MIDFDKNNDDLNRDVENLAWEKMRQLLDSELPESAPVLPISEAISPEKEQKKRRFIIFWLFLTLGVAGAGTYFWQKKNVKTHEVKVQADFAFEEKAIETEEKTIEKTVEKIITQTNQASINQAKKLKNNQIKTQTNKLDVQNSKNRLTFQAQKRAQNQVGKTDFDPIFSAKNSSETRVFLGKNSSAKLTPNAQIGENTPNLSRAISENLEQKTPVSPSETGKNLVNSVSVPMFESVADAEKPMRSKQNDLTQNMPLTPELAGSGFSKKSFSISPFLPIKNTETIDFEVIRPSFSKIITPKVTIKTAANWRFGIKAGGHLYADLTAISKLNQARGVLTGFVVERNFNKKWAAQVSADFRWIGFNNQNIEYLKSPFNNVNQGGVSASPNFPNPLIRSGKLELLSMQIWEMPITIQYNFTHRFSTFLGIKPFYLGQKKYGIVDTSGNVFSVSLDRSDVARFSSLSEKSSTGNNLDSEEQATAFKKFGIASTAGLRYHLTPKWTISTHFDYGFGNLAYSEKVKIYNRSFNFNLIYWLR